MLVVFAFSFPALIQLWRRTGIGSLLATIPLSAAQVARFLNRHPSLDVAYQKSLRIARVLLLLSSAAIEQLGWLAFCVVLWGTMIGAVAIRSQYVQILDSTELSEGCSEAVAYLSAISLDKTVPVRTLLCPHSRFPFVGCVPCLPWYGRTKGLA